MKKRTSKRILLSIVILALIFLSLGPLMSQVEQPEYVVVEADNSIEIRDYPKLLIAETLVSGPRPEAINKGFTPIADFIFGNNAGSNEIAMTAPVMQQAGEKIAMTAPVTQEMSDDKWKVSFIMPSHYTMQTLPKPTNPEVQIREIASRRVAAIRFRGSPSEENLKEHNTLLEKFIETRQLKKVGVPAYAFYNPPWTAPFLRRNEIMVEIEKN